MGNLQGTARINLVKHVAEAPQMTTGIILLSAKWDDKKDIKMIAGLL